MGWGGARDGPHQQHAACVAKRHLAAIWAARETTRHVSAASEGPEQQADGEDTPSRPARAPPPQLEDLEDVDRATLLAVAEAFGASMAKHYLSQMLPTASFGDRDRRAWLDTVVHEQSLLGSAEQLLAFRLAEHFRVSSSQETAAAREAAEAAAAKREAAAADWLEGWQRSGAAAGPPPGDVELLEVAKVVAKTTVKREVAHFLEVQLLPMVRTQLRERVVPALLTELREMVSQFLRKHRRWVGLTLFAGTSALAAMTLGPWVAVFVLLRRRRSLD